MEAIEKAARQEGVHLLLMALDIAGPAAAARTAGMIR
jgi:hypothetical protein